MDTFRIINECFLAFGYQLVDVNWRSDFFIHALDIIAKIASAINNLNERDIAIAFINL